MKIPRSGQHALDEIASNHKRRFRSGLSQFDWCRPLTFWFSPTTGSLDYHLAHK
jgi:hypothetical protein